MEKVQAVKDSLKICIENENCEGCIFAGSDHRCINRLLTHALELLEFADSRLYNIEKMLTEWSMVDQREALIREAFLWHKQKGDSDE